MNSETHFVFTQEKHNLWHAVQPCIIYNNFYLLIINLPSHYLCCTHNIIGAVVAVHIIIITVIASTNVKILGSRSYLYVTITILIVNNKKLITAK